MNEAGQPEGLVSFSTYKMIEFILLFSLPFIFGIHQLRALKKLDEKEAAKRAAEEKAGAGETRQPEDAAR
jgi:hypothetical protein